MARAAGACPPRVGRHSAGLDARTTAARGDVGDVAIYVTAHTLSTFDQIRDDIKALVRRVVCAIYQQGRYERVVQVGHSPGSLIAYDALNATMLADSLSGAYGVQRTRRFVTFGSPLDKTAFFFRAVDAVNAPIRARPGGERAAAADLPAFSAADLPRGRQPS